MLYPRAQCYLQTWHRHWARGSQVRLLYICGISWTKSVHSYSDTSSSHHTYCVCMNHLCTAHVVNLADPGVARFLASQMKLLCRCSHKLPCVWKSNKCNNLFTPSNSSQLKFPENNQHLQPTVWYMVAMLSRAFSVLQFTVSGKWVYERRGKKRVCFIHRNSCIGFAWQGFGSRGATGVASVRSC